MKRVSPTPGGTEFDSMPAGRIRLQGRIIPVELVQMCLVVIKAAHKLTFNNPGDLPRRIATRRNLVAAALLLDVLDLLRAAHATFKIRVLL
jgi:hypothetical protein